MRPTCCDEDGFSVRSLTVFSIASCSAPKLERSEGRRGVGVGVPRLELLPLSSVRRPSLSTFDAPRHRYQVGWDEPRPALAKVVLLVSFVVYIVSFFLMLALSRYGEFSADRGAALVTGRPSALSSALIKISGQMERLLQQDLRATFAERTERRRHSTSQRRSE